MPDSKNENSEFTLHRLETDGDIEQYLELIRNVFGQTSGVDNLAKNLIDHHPNMTLKNFFVMEHQGKMVATLNLIPVRWSIGGIPLRVAEMGHVATLAEYRHRGLQRMLANEFHKEVERQGYDVCAIEGIAYFYRQFGYEYALPLLEETKIRLEQLPTSLTKTDIRSFTPDDIQRAGQLLAQSQTRFYVHTIRDESIWRMQEETKTAAGDKFEGYSLDRNGEMVAYFRISDRPEEKALVLREASNMDDHSNEAILGFLKDVGRQRSFEYLVSRMSYHDPLTQKLVSLGAVQDDPPYAWQIRVPDYAAVFWKMKPLLERRLAESSYSHLTEKLNFNFRRYTVQINVEDGSIRDTQKLDTNEDRTIGLNPLVFVQLLLGHRSRQELEMIYPDFRIRQSHKHLIDVLFPKSTSYIHAAY
jgi:predicted acetyltransferase